MAAGVRAEANVSGDRMNAKIRDAQMQKIPYMLVIGDREVADSQVNLRMRDGSKPGPMGVPDVVALIEGAVAAKRVL
jgi:threonyl-tRNA synthetase